MTKPERSSCHDIRPNVNSGNRNRTERLESSPNQFRFLNKSHYDSICQKAQHGRKTLAIEKEEGNDHSSDWQSQGLLSSCSIPLRQSSTPSPSMMPRTTGFVVIFSIQVMAPVNPIRSQKRPVKIPDPQIIPWVIARHERWPSLQLLSWVE